MKRKPKRGPDEISPLVQEMIDGMDATVAAIKAGEPLAKFTTRSVKADVAHEPFGPEDLKAARARLSASQPVLAKFLGVSPQTLRGWEQGTRRVPTMAIRFLEVIETNPQIWAEYVQSAKE